MPGFANFMKRHIFGFPSDACSDLRSFLPGLGRSWFRCNRLSRTGFTCLDSRVSSGSWLDRIDLTRSSATQYLLALASATLFYNLLDCPVGSIPVTRVDPNLDALPTDWLTETSSSTPSSKEIDAFLYGGKWGYNAEEMTGLPVGIQIVGKRWEDEKVVEMMKVVDAALGERGFGPDGWEKWKAAHPS